MRMCLLQGLILVLVTYVFLINGLQEYCESEDFQAKCSPSQVVVITKALYGRMHQGRCVSIAERGCEMNVKHIMDGWCSGRSSCQVPVANLISESGGMKHCSADYRSYLEAGYNCTKAYPSVPAICDGPLSVTSAMSPVYISSTLAQTTQCAYLNKPITVTAKPGQYLNITILDFSVKFNNEQRFDLPSKCEVYAVIKDTALPEGSSPKTVCGARSYEQHVIKTIANEVEIRTMQTEVISFLLKINVLGCPDPPVSRSTKLIRSLHRVKITCPGSIVDQVLECVHGHWVGDFKNCSKSSTQIQSDASLMKGITLSEELSVLIIAMVALLVGVFVLAIGVVCLKRYSQQRISHPVESTQEYWPPPPPEITQDTGFKPTDDPDLSNKYYRTWQLQQHHSTAGQNAPPPYSSNNSERGGNMFSDNILSNGQHHPVEHIYESPKFDNDSVYSAPERITTGSTSSYFDLDPGVMIHPSNAHVIRGNR